MLSVRPTFECIAVKLYTSVTQSIPRGVQESIFTILKSWEKNNITLDYEHYISISRLACATPSGDVDTGAHPHYMTITIKAKLAAIKIA